MIEIRDLLGKFKNILLSEEGKKESIKKVISEVININIESKNITIKNNIIYLNIKPIYKNEILIKQDQIFLKLQKLFLNKGPDVIR